MQVLAHIPTMESSCRLGFVFVCFALLHCSARCDGQAPCRLQDVAKTMRPLGLFFCNRPNPKPFLLDFLPKKTSRDHQTAHRTGGGRLGPSDDRSSVRTRVDRSEKTPGKPSFHFATLLRTRARGRDRLVGWMEADGRRGRSRVKEKEERT